MAAWQHGGNMAMKANQYLHGENVAANEESNESA